MKKLIKYTKKHFFCLFISQFLFIGRNIFWIFLFLASFIGGGPTLHPPTLHEDNSTQKRDTERLYTRVALHQITLHENE